MTNLMYYINENFAEPSEGLENALLKEDYCAYAAAFAGIATFVLLNVLLYRSEKRKKNFEAAGGGKRHFYNGSFDKQL